MNKNTISALTAESFPVRRSHLRKLVVALTALPFLGALAAFGLAPDTSTSSIRQTAVTEPLNLPAAVLAAADDAATTYVHDEVVRPGDTLADVLARMNVGALDAQQLLATPELRDVAAGMHTGQRLHGVTTGAGDMVALRYKHHGKQVELKREGARLTQVAEAPLTEVRTVLGSGTIEGSFYAATDKAEVPEKIADRLAELFGTMLDFRNDLHRGDTFTVAYSVTYRNGEPASVGKVLAAEVRSGGKTYRVALFHNAAGKEAYYKPNGESLDKGFLRSPLEFTRVTSNFSASRVHPLLGYARAHTGVDLGAPTGTHIKAPGDGVVEFQGVKGGYGNLLILKHAGGYETYYGHLSGFAKGLHRGSSVKRGQMVAFVGATGEATGPHLHYEVRIAGTPYNPMTVKLPGTPPLTVAQRHAFDAAYKPVLAHLDQMHGVNLAALE